MLRGRGLPCLLDAARSLIGTVSPFGDIWSEKGSHDAGSLESCTNYVSHVCGLWNQETWIQM